MLIVLPVLYVLAFDRLIVPADPDRDPSYGSFLLRELDGPRLLVEAGSSSIHGLDPAQMEDAFGRPVAILADHAGYPLFLKIRRLEAYLQPGDVVVMPLEWTYYSDELIDRQIGPNLHHALSSYYRPLTPWERARFVLRRLNLDAFVFAARERLAAAIGSPNAAVLDILTPLQTRFLRSPFNGLLLMRDELDAAPPPADCRTALRFNLSVMPADALAAFRELERLEAKGARVILTWPAVVGPSCYGDPDPRLAAFETAVRREAAAMGIEVAGTPRRSWLADNRYYLNTPFHLTREGAQIRTRALVEDLQPLLARPGDTSPAGTAEQAGAALRALGERLLEPVLADLRPLESGTFSAARGSLSDRLALGLGWDLPEVDGPWSLGPASDIFVRLGPAPCTLRLDGYFHHEAASSAVTVDGQASSVSEDIRLPAGNDVVRLRIAHANVLAPSDRGPSADTRPINFKLRSIASRCDLA